MTLADDLHIALDQTFKNVKTGYCWIAAKFGPTKYLTDAELRTAIMCVESKRHGTKCPYHRRVHDSKKRMRHES